MKSLYRVTALLLLFVLIPQFIPPARACGPEILEPIFVLNNSPDPPFKEFTQGKIGIVKPSFGRKTLLIAYRYLNGGAFTEDEQKELVEALKGASPETNSDGALKTWIAARQLVVKDEGELPEIYQTRGGYDFFPNCTANAFEIAAETLKDRVARFGVDDKAVHEWLSGQDVVFSNCSGGSVMPANVGAESPAWLRKDREYQTAAALFYSLKFDQARVGFEKIAQDVESDWQQTADYLVGRTLIRQASFEEDEKTKRTLYEKAETYLLNLHARAGKYRLATQKLLALTKYRLHPEERVRELAQVLADQNGNDNLRQDLIDYVWLLDKFDQQVQEAEAERLKLLNSPPEPLPPVTPPQPDAAQLEWKRNSELLERGELIQLWVPSVNADGQINYTDSKNFFFKSDASRAEVLEIVETAFGRKLSEAELKQLWERHPEALEFRKYRLSPNRKFAKQSDYEGCYYDCKTPILHLLPSFLMMDELSDWIFTFQSDDATAFSHAFTKWRQTQSDAWFVAALTKANKGSSSLNRLLVQAETIQPDAPVYATVVYHRIRLLSDLGKASQARQMLDEIIATKLDMFPVSAQNEFLEQRMDLATGIGEFLKFAARKPVMFYEYGTGGTIRDLVQIEKEYLAKEGDEEAAEQQNERVEKLYQWDDRLVFDQKVVEILNWHFPTSALMTGAHDPALPDYLRERLLFTVWTRAILLKQDAVAQQAATEIVEKGQDPFGVFREYLKARSVVEKRNAATYILVRLPSLSPYVAYGIPEPDTGDTGYYFELAWWCTLEETEYNEESREVPKRVAHPPFLTGDFLATAQKERAIIRAAGNAKKLIGKRVIEWARQSPTDTGVPEALFVAAMANQNYKYGCGGWEHDEEIQQEAESLLLDHFGGTVWPAKLREQR